MEWYTTAALFGDSTLLLLFIGLHTQIHIVNGVGSD